MGGTILRAEDAGVHATHSRIDLGSLLNFYEQSEKARSDVSYNIEALRCIRGGLRMAERRMVSFDPRAEYWYLPERRLLLAYFADRWTGRFAPAIVLRSIAQRAFSYFDQARTLGLITYTGVDYEAVPGGFTKLCSDLAEYADKFPILAEWRQLRDVWPKIAETPAGDIATFLHQAAKQEKWESGFQYRLPWFGYLGATSEEQLRNRQAFFYAYANLWTTANSYKLGGGMDFAPVVQNTSTNQLVEAAIQWKKGTNPIKTGFLVLGRDDDEPQDRSHYSVVREIYGFLNLERIPFYNSRVDKRYRDWFNIHANVDVYTVTATVGAVTAQWLSENTAAVKRLCALFRSAMNEPWTPRIEFESIELPKKKHAHATEDRLDLQLFKELDTEATSELMGLGERDAASAMLHLLLDSKVTSETSSVGKRIITTTEPDRPVAPESAASPSVQLPEALRPFGERALAYLRAGFHVLFAGAPGTGKTTLAQFVGCAWNHELDTLPEQMVVVDAPLTTVGSSAWSPFHTIGGLVPTEERRFEPRAGIFIDPDCIHAAKAWQLRNEALVLDEMNRADLDRCIGELYPLLSGSVDQVSPAGLLGVDSIKASPRFRVLATVNDAHLDDIVFPISEGLARRLQRIELPGASKNELLIYLGLDGPTAQWNSRQKAAFDSAIAFFDFARQHKDKLLEPADEDRLRIGVAYFAPVRAWIYKELDLPLAQGTEVEQVREVLLGSLSVLKGAKEWSKGLRSFLAKA